MIKLQAKKEAIDVGRVGLFSGVYTMMTDIDVRALSDAVSRYVLAQALIDNISNTEGGLVCRDLLPDKDLLDGSGTAITSRDWRQPVTGNFTTATGASATAVSVYKTSRTSDNDRKVIGIFGIRLVGVGHSRQHAVLAHNSIIWKRSDVKTIDIWSTQAIECSPSGSLWGMTPLLFKRGDDLNVLFVPNSRMAVSASKYDMIQIVAKVAEALGANVTG